MKPPINTLSLQEWVARIRDQEMPIFGHTVQSIVGAADNDATPAAELAKAILQDASMTARVLKLANTIFYNPREQGISTVSRAVVVLGFNTVRNMCLSIVLVDTLVRGNARDRLTKELARSIHAAVQARSIAEARGDKSPEEVFIATLLFHLGELAFWCFSGEVGEELDQRIKQGKAGEEEAQQALLGFRLRSLSNQLAHEWKLNELLTETLAAPERASARGRTVVLAHELAEVAEVEGWGSDAAEQLMKQIATHAGESPKQMAELLHHNAREAAKIARCYGAASAAQAIPMPGHEVEPAPAEERAPPDYPAPDGMLQLKILRELSQMQESHADFNLIMELVLEGIYRGVGTDRALFALLTPDKRGLRAKFALGHQAEELSHAFHFTQLPNLPNLLFQAIEKRSCAWADIQRVPELARLIPPLLIDVVGNAPFLIAPLVVNEMGIGLIYADRTPSGRPLDEESFDSFRHFAKQASMGLTQLAQRKRR